MSKRRFRLPSPALVISMITLSLVLGGTAFAAAASHGDKKADTKLVKKLAPSLSVKHAKTADSATNAAHATSADSATNATHATSADSATNATNAANAEPVAFAHVSKTAVLDTANSKGVTGVTLNGTSIYCLTGISSTVRGGQATVDEQDSGRETAQFGLGDFGGSCPAGTKAFVFTETSTAASAAGFFVVLYG